MRLRCNLSAERALPGMPRYWLFSLTLFRPWVWRLTLLAYFIAILVLVWQSFSDVSGYRHIWPINLRHRLFFGFSWSTVIFVGWVLRVWSVTKRHRRLSTSFATSGIRWKRTGPGLLSRIVLLMQWLNRKPACSDVFLLTIPMPTIDCKSFNAIPWNVNFTHFLKSNACLLASRRHNILPGVKLGRLNFQKTSFWVRILVLSIWDVFSLRRGERTLSVLVGSGCHVRKCPLSQNGIWCHALAHPGFQVGLFLLVRWCFGEKFLGVGLIWRKSIGQTFTQWKYFFIQINQKAFNLNSDSGFLTLINVVTFRDPDFELIKVFDHASKALFGFIKKLNGGHLFLYLHIPLTIFLKVHFKIIKLIMKH